MGQSIIVGGSNYGQGSSREHAALAPLYLGVKAVVTNSFARIHRSNLINAGILPCVFCNEADYDSVSEGDVLRITNVKEAILSDGTLTLQNETTGKAIPICCELSDRAKQIMLAGGLLSFTKQQLEG